MKLRKAIKLAAAGAVVGAAPMLAMASSAGLGNSVTFDGAGNATPNCPTGTGWTCNTADAITDDGFVMFQAIDPNGNSFYVTGINDVAEGTFNTLTVVGENSNDATHNEGAYNKTVIGEAATVGDPLSVDFNSVSTITTGDYMSTTMVSGQGPDAGSVMGMMKVNINQTLSNTNGFDTGFTFKHGMIMGEMAMFKDFDINLNVVDGTPNSGQGQLTNTFQMLETSVEGMASQTTVDAIVGKTLLIDESINDQTNTNDTFTQRFIQNEAEGTAVAAAGTVAAGPSGTGTFTFAAGDTLAVKTLAQNMNGAPADFGLSDAADETLVAAGSTISETGVDNFLGATGMSGTYTATGLSDPFVSF